MAPDPLDPQSHRNKQTKCWELLQAALHVHFNTRTDLIANADQSIIKAKCQILAIISPATASDSTAYFMFGHWFLLRWPQTWKYVKEKAMNRNYLEVVTYFINFTNMVKIMIMTFSWSHCNGMYYYNISVCAISNEIVEQSKLLLFRGPSSFGYDYCSNVLSFLLSNIKKLKTLTINNTEGEVFEESNWKSLISSRNKINITHH